MHRARVIETILWLAHHADDLILATTPGEIEDPPPPPMPIWGDLDEREAGLLADMLIDQGRRYVVVAQTVRGLSKAWSYLEIGEITVPRFLLTAKWYLAHGFAVNFGFFRLEFGGPRYRRVQP